MKLTQCDWRVRRPPRRGGVGWERWPTGSIPPPEFHPWLPALAPLGLGIVTLGRMVGEIPISETSGPVLHNKTAEGGPCGTQPSHD